MTKRGLLLEDFAVPPTIETVTLDETIRTNPYLPGLPTSMRRSRTKVARLPKRLGRVLNTTTSQTGIGSAGADLSGMSLNFSVTDYPVRVRLVIAYAYITGAAGSVRASLADSSSTVTLSCTINFAGVNYGARFVIEEEFLVAGDYFRKGRINNNNGAGGQLANTLVVAEYPMWMEAVEFAA